MEKLLKIIFPMVFGNHSAQENQTAFQIFSLIKDYIDPSKQNENCLITDQNQKVGLTEYLTGIDQETQKDHTPLMIQFMCEYGCAILFKKPKRQSTIKVQIIYPQQWGTGASSTSDQKFDYCEPKNFKVLHLNQVLEHELILPDFVTRFKTNLSYAFEIVFKRNAKLQNLGQQFTYLKTFSPKQVEEAAKIAQQKLPVHLTVSYQVGQETEKQRIQRQQSVNPLSSNFSFQQSATNTAWYVAEAVIQALLDFSKEEEKSLVSKLIIGFRGQILMKAILDQKQQRSKDRIFISQLKKCLDELIAKYGRTVSKYFQDQNAFNKLAIKIQEDIINLSGGSTTTKLINQTLNKQNMIIQSKQKPILKKPVKPQPSQNKITLATINQYTLKIQDDYTPFQALLNQKYKEKIPDDQWILLVQDVIFSFAQKLRVKKSLINLGIAMRQIQCEIGASVLCKVVLLYQQIVQANSLHYGMGMQSQAHSHLCLIKIIASAIVFQMVKIHREMRQSNLNGYKMPISIQKIFDHFISHSYEARKAMKYMLEYQSSRTTNKNLFQFNGNDSSYREYAIKIAKQTRAAYVWKSNQEDMLTLQKKLFLKDVHSKIINQNYKTLYDKYNSAIMYWGNSNSWFKPIAYQYNPEINFMVTQISPQGGFIDQDTKDLHAFMNSIPPDVLGMLKIFRITQGHKDKKKSQEKNLYSKINLQFAKEEAPTQIYAIQPTKKTQSIYSSSCKTIDNVPINRISSSTQLLYDNYDQEDTFTQESFELYPNAQQLRSLINLLKPPKLNDDIREHQVLALQYNHAKMGTEQFLGTGYIRSAHQTQLIVLCENILNRKTNPNIIDKQTLFQEQTFMNSAGQLKAYNPKTQTYFGHLKKLILQFQKGWLYSDVNFCPIFVPTIGQFIQQLKHDKVYGNDTIGEFEESLFSLIRKCKQEFYRFQLEAHQNPQITIRWRQRFICLATICCFRQYSIRQETPNQIKQIFIEFLLQNRNSKILADREQRDPKERKLDQTLKFSIEKAIFKNIKIAADYLEQNPHKITEILRIIDESAPHQIVWEQKQVYQFIGNTEETNDIYQIDLYNGYVYKNGKQISGLNKEIKQSPLFIKIFGKQKEFQVFPRPKSNYLRTRKNLNHFFRLSKDVAEVFFEFADDGTDIQYIVRYVDANFSKQQIWSVIDINILRTSNCHFPQTYLNDYIAWIHQQSKCVIFRRPNLEKIHEIGLILYLDDIQNLTIKKGYILKEHDQIDWLKLIKDQQNDKYDQIILRSKSQFKSLTQIKPYQILKKFEQAQYIIEIKEAKTSIIYFWLHRYQMKFKANKEYLASQSHLGYVVDYSYYQNRQSLFNKFVCLVMRKNSDDAMLMNSQDWIIVVKDGHVQSNGIINNKDDKTSSAHISSFKYQVHDFFGDIRGQSRESQLHMANIMISINNQLKLHPMEMTPLQYGMHLMKTCFTNRPFTQRQINKLKNILELGNDVTMLLCQILWTASQRLRYVVFFSNKQSIFNNIFRSKQDVKESNRTLYQKKIVESLIPFRERIPQDLLSFIGLTIIEQAKGSKNKIFKTQTKRLDWKGVKQFTGEQIQSKATQIQKLFREFKDMQKKAIIIWNQSVNQEQRYGDDFPNQIQKQGKQNPQDAMIRQMVGQLKGSYDIYQKEQNRLKKIQSKIVKRQLISQNKQLQDKAQQILRLIQATFDQIKKISNKHPQVISGLRPSLSYCFFTEILCQKDRLKTYFPHLNTDKSTNLKNIIKIWTEMKIRIASFKRIEIILKNQQFDLIAYQRQVLSPREQVFKKPWWLCFQAQMRVQLWLSQFQTYQNLIQQNETGAFCQLNMGQGKTQVIIPLMILDNIYSKDNCIPRINLLSSLFQEAKSNFFRFISVTGFQIPGFELPFDRKVKLTTQNILTVQHVINCFSKKVYILMTRQARLSLTLRYHEQNQSKIKLQQNKDQLEPLFKNEIFDIFDQIDAMMTPKRSYIYSVGPCENLPNSQLRLELLRLCLEQFLTHQLMHTIRIKMATVDEPLDEALEIVNKGRFPGGFRFTLDKFVKSDLLEMRKTLAISIIKNPQRYQFSFVKQLSETQVNQLIDYIVDSQRQQSLIPKRVRIQSRGSIYLLRGALGYGIFEHCLSMRCGVDYGVPAKHPKRVAVPYQAADIPSKRSEYAHPDVSALLSYLAYYTKGLTYDQFQQALINLLKLSDTTKQNSYKSWFETLSKQQKQKLEIHYAKQINYDSKVHRQKLYQSFKLCRRTIAFWLTRCVFPKDLRQYMESITASSWDLANVKKSVGFSGTKDNHWLFPSYLHWEQSKSLSIKGTDGRMLSLMIKQTKEVCVIQQNEKTLWQRFLDLALEKKVGCVIDAGAICVGKSLKNQIVPWVAEHKNFDHHKYQGISYCDDTGRWEVYDILARNYIGRGTTIPDHSTFVIFDEARTRGADLKMAEDVTAALSVGPQMTKDKLMQAAGRLRKIGRRQNMIILATPQVLSGLQGLSDQTRIKQKLAQMNPANTVKNILGWVCRNSVHDNEKLLLQFALLGWKHLYSVQEKVADPNKTNPQLQMLYKDSLSVKTAYQINKGMKERYSIKIQQSTAGEKICKKMQEFGKNFKINSSSFDDICERQVQVAKQQQHEKQNAQHNLMPFKQIQNAPQKQELPLTPFQLSKNLFLSQNLIKTTNDHVRNIPDYYQMPQCYFALIDTNKLKLISLRQAAIHIRNHIIGEKMGEGKLRLISELHIQDEQIVKYKIQEAVVETKFIAGYEQYSIDEQNILLKMLCRSLKSWKGDHQELVSLILKKKNLVHKKFNGSTLETMITQLTNVINIEA